MDSLIKDPISIEELLAGTSQLLFLQELTMIMDEELLDTFPLINEGEVFLGHMTPLEKRINLWYVRKVDEIRNRSNEISRAHCPACRVACGSPAASSAPCAELVDFAGRIVERYQSSMCDLIIDRFPNIKGGVTFRHGFQIVTNVCEDPCGTNVHPCGMADFADVSLPLIAQIVTKKPS